MPKGEEQEADLLNSEACVLAYLRAAMLEFGDDPHAMAVAMNTVEIARAKLQRKGPLRVSANVIEMNRATAKAGRDKERRPL